MSVDAKARHRLHTKLEKVLGADEADTLMQAVPPYAWNQIATKDYLDLKLEVLESRLTGFFHEQIAGVRADLSVQTRTMILAMVATVISLAGLFAALVKLG